MKLFEVTNGYEGTSYVRVVVIAPDEETALKMAVRAYLADENYRSKEWSLKAECLCEDTSEPWCSRPSDSGIESPEPTWGEIDSRGGDGWSETEVNDEPAL